MAEPGSKSETKQKIESKPMVENKAPEEAPAKSKKPWMLIGILILIFAGGAAVVAIPSARGAVKAGWTKLMGSEHKKEEVKATLPLEPFLVNLADTDEIRFVKATFQLGLAKAPNEEVKSGPAIPAIRDSIISLLTSKRSEQILTPEGKDSLRKEIQSRVNAVSPETRVLEVYIVDFVVQL